VTTGPGLLVSTQPDRPVLDLCAGSNVNSKRRRAHPDHPRGSV